MSGVTRHPRLGPDRPQPRPAPSVLDWLLVILLGLMLAGLAYGWWLL